MNPESPRILLIRRDNIGDLALTTPLFTALRRRYPESTLWALVTSYNRAVLEHHPAIDRVVAYTKAKHLDPGESIIGCHIERLRLLLALRRQKFDYCVLAAPGYQKRALSLARWVGARHVVGFVEKGKPHAALIDRPIPWRFDASQSETEDVWGLAQAFDINEPPGKLEIHPDPAILARLQAKTANTGPEHVVGIHLSARKPSQRWPVERYAKLLRQLHHTHACRFMLFWSPGTPDNPRHPGDDDKAVALLANLGDLPIQPMPTHTLDQLIAALSLCDEVICPDGGAMHLAAALGKPIVCMFGHSNPIRWRPWGVPYRLLQTASQNVADISAVEVAAAYTALCKELEQP